MSERDAHGSLTPLWLQILLALADDARYGYGILKEIERQTGGRMSPRTGSLYAALQRLADEELIREAPEAVSPEEDDRRRYYALTPAGRKALHAETRRLLRTVDVAAEKDVVPASGRLATTGDA